MIYIFGAFGVVILLLGLAVGFEHVRVISANNRVTAVEAQLKAAETRAEAFALMWQAQAEDAEASKRKADDARQAQFSMLDARVRGLGGKCVAPSDVGQLLADIARAANAAGVAAVDSGSDPVPAPAKSNRANK